MKNTVVQLLLVIIGVWSIHAARLMATASFQFRIDPAGSAGKVEAIQGHDTVQITRTSDGYYAQRINPGRWSVLVHASAPYKDYRHDLTAWPGRSIDLGTLRLPRE